LDKEDGLGWVDFLGKEDLLCGRIVGDFFGWRFLGSRRFFGLERFSGLGRFFRLEIWGWGDFLGLGELLDRRDFFGCRFF
jgi:hypothetical protein